MDKFFLKQNAGHLGITLDDAQLDKFYTYHKELLNWNDKINLVSEQSAKDITARHFLDSLTALRFIDKQSARVLDIGSGAGFPGIPLKIARPSLEVYLLESNRKKTSFLKYLVRELQLDKVIVVHDRAEHLMKNKAWKEFFDFVVSRAAFHLEDFIQFSAFFLRAQGQFIALKGEGVEPEFSQCVKNATTVKIFELLQYDTDVYPQGKKGKIIVGKRLKKDKKPF
ncbi:MAG: 16S rRNA (guanine(527)-N(7))-methyltransferase RsmG [Syntrophaceae bacterium]|nr:16S rRNA (guanine(527)-N(7))-methyltransferase RsmG [Syntrophaceae bacterium]